jgi:hypothetical protein
MPEILLLPYQTYFVYGLEVSFREFIYLSSKEKMNDLEKWMAVSGVHALSLTAHKGQSSQG